MCGIAGIFDVDRGIDPGIVPAMLDSLEHRGPDGSGIFTSDSVVLGHRRLAIIDTSSDGTQPMRYADDRYVITFNGEIYNYIELRAELSSHGYTFVSQSDTEVLLAAYAHWGRECLHHLNGMFAFALYDRRAQRLLCARDRLGVKPFAYTWNGRRMAFASEAKALIAAGAISGDIDADGLYEFLARGYAAAGKSSYAGMRVLEPGHALEISPRGYLRTWRWWDPVTTADESDLTASQWSEQVAQILDDAVQIRLRSDVPVGAHLSGGLDSSAIVAAAARSGSADIATFTGAFRDDHASDEREFSRAVTSMYELDAHEITMSVDDLPAVFERLMWHLDEPIAGPGAFPQLLVCDLAARHGYKVVLGGQGGDELFGGYLRHRALYWKQQARRGHPLAALELMRLAAGEAHRLRRSSTRTQDADLSPEFLDRVSRDVRENARRPRLSFSNARELMLHDVRSYLPALLQVEDRTSMAASIESRTPMLDYRLVELALRIPEHHLFARGVGKPILHGAVDSWLPTAVSQRRDKRGFPTPLHRWSERPQLRNLVHELTTPRTSAAESIFAAPYLQRRDSLQSSELWTVLSVHGWLNQLARPYSRNPLPIQRPHAV